MLLPGLQFWRARRGYTQAQLAERIGMRRPTVWRIEAGRPARVRTAHLLATALGVHLSRLQLHPDPHPVDPPTLLPQTLPTRYSARPAAEAIRARRAFQARLSGLQAANGDTRAG